jgi:hypothetical protein
MISAKITPFLLLLLLTFGIAATHPLSAEDQSTLSGNEVVQVAARLVSKQERKDLANTSADKITQTRSLVIEIRGKSKPTETRSGKWVIYGKDLVSNRVKPVESGEIRIDLSSGRQIVETKDASLTYTPEHTTVTNSKTKNRSGDRKSKSQPVAKREAASGVRYYGYSVEIKDGSRIVGTASDPAGVGNGRE